MAVIEVAIVDDHKLVRNAIANILSQMDGIEVSILASNGAELISMLEQASNLPDVCLVDIQMPVMNGYDTAMNLKKRWPQIRILALSAFDNIFHVLEMLSNGAGGFLTKDCDPEELRSAIISINELGYYHSDLAPKRLHTAVKNKELGNPRLTDNERLVLQHICTSKSYREIAEVLNFTARSVEGYRDSLFHKFNVNDRGQLAVLAYYLQLTYSSIPTNFRVKRPL